MRNLFWTKAFRGTILPCFSAKHKDWNHLFSYGLVQTHKITGGHFFTGFIQPISKWEFVKLNSIFWHIMSLSLYEWNFPFISIIIDQQELLVCFYFMCSQVFILGLSWCAYCSSTSPRSAMPLIYHKKHHLFNPLCTA